MGQDGQVAMPLSEKFGEAIEFAMEIHNEPRKGTSIPYISHLMAVSSILLDMYGDEDEAIAGVLHDVIEDSDGRVTAADVSERFGARVAKLVEDSSEPETEDRSAATWIKRKGDYHDSLDGKEGDSLRVSLADKIANLRTILIDSREGPEFWTRFKDVPQFDTQEAAQVWNYTELAKRFEANRNRMGDRAQVFVDEFSFLVARLPDAARPS